MNVVLVEPQIPQNTGSIARTCAATGVSLHLVGPHPFDLSEKRVRRAGLDYWPYVSLTEHTHWEEYRAQNPQGTVWLLSSFGTVPYYNASFSDGDSLVFGSESKGLGKVFCSRFPDSQILTIPMSCPEVRSLNLSNAVSIVLFEALRQREHIASEHFIPRQRTNQST